MLLTLLFLSSVISLTHSANILAVVPAPSYSHQIAFTQLWKELSLRGHKVTLITTDPLKDPKLVNLTEIDTKFVYKFLEGFSKTAENSITMWTFYDTILDLVKQVSEAQLSFASVQELIHQQSGRKFDVVLVEFLFIEMLGFAELYNCPKVIISSIEPNFNLYHVMGSPAHPVLNPDFTTPFYGRLNFQDRLMSTVFSWYLSSYFMEYRWYPEKQEILHKYFNTTTTLKELLHKVDMLFINANPVLQDVRSLSPAVVNIGPRELFFNQPLSENVKEFLDNAKEGFIYFSLGTNIKSNSLEKETFHALLEALSEVSYKVLWKFEDEEMPDKPGNVKLIKWAPQQAILSHPHIKLFITQGGAQSMEEAVYNAVPCVVIPFYADQERNARVMESKGIARIVGRSPFVDKEQLKSAIEEVINNSKYANTAKELKRLLLDMPMTGLEKAIWWTEYLIRNKGAEHLRNPVIDLPLYQYYLLDVFSFLITISFLTLLVVVILIKILINVFLCIFKRKDILENKKTQ